MGICLQHCTDVNNVPIIIIIIIIIITIFWEWDEYEPME